jgi:hypothetical protein
VTGLATTRAGRAPALVPDFVGRLLAARCSASQDAVVAAVAGEQTLSLVPRDLDGTSQIQRLVIAREVLRPRRVEEPATAAA